MKRKNLEHLTPEQRESREGVQQAIREISGALRKAGARQICEYRSINLENESTISKFFLNGKYWIVEITYFNSGEGFSVNTYRVDGANCLNYVNAIALIESEELA